MRCRLPTGFALAILALIVAVIPASCGGALSQGGGAAPNLSKFVLPAGFSIALVSKHVPGARYMAFGPSGELVVSETSLGNVVIVSPSLGADTQPRIFASGLPFPHGLAFHGGKLYVATWAGVTRYDYPSATPTVLFSNMPQGGDHNRRALAIASDGTIFISSGSDCNVCNEGDPRFATVLRYAPGDSVGSIYSRGLRNASGLAFDAAGTLWATVNQRDNIGPTQDVTDNLPPDEIDAVVADGNYGWPQCYPNPAAPNRLRNPEYPGANCSGQVAAALNFQAHSAPLGITFYEASQFSPQYRGDAFVAFHGSWNRSVPTGDKVVLVKFSGGRPVSYSDFVTGWLQNGQYDGRPAGVAVAPDGSLYISDDLNGYVYRVTYSGANSR